MLTPASALGFLGSIHPPELHYLSSPVYICDYCSPGVHRGEEALSQLQPGHGMRLKSANHFKLILFCTKSKNFFLSFLVPQLACSLLGSPGVLVLHQLYTEGKLGAPGNSKQDPPLRGNSDRLSSLAKSQPQQLSTDSTGPPPGETRIWSLLREIPPGHCLAAA